MLRITQSAKDILRSILRDNPGFDLRLFCAPSDQSGLELGLTVDRRRERDRCLRIDDLEIYLDDQVKCIDGEAVIDFAPDYGLALVAGGGSCY